MNMRAKTEQAKTMSIRQALVAGAAALTIGAGTSVAADPDEIAAALQGKNWPCWRGPDGSGFGLGCGGTLVDDLADMRRVWRSQERNIPANCWHNGTQGGYDSPIVANGKVIISYFKGTGAVMDPALLGNRTNEASRWNAAVVTEDAVLCADARTGATLWKKVLGEGINLHQRRKEGPHQSPCWHDGKIYAQSTLARVYCLNDANGDILWQADGPATPHLLRVQAVYRKTGKQHPYRGLEPPEFENVGWPELCMMPLAVADGVVVADGGGKLAAFDAATGTVLKWKSVFGTGGRSGLAPLRWVCGGTEWFIVGNACVRPRTGETVWQVKEASGRNTPAIGDGYMVLAAAQGGFLCGRAGAGGFVKVWHNADYGGAGAMAAIGAIHKGWFFAEVHSAGGRAKMPPGATELAIGIELATGKVVGPVSFAGVSQTLCTSPVGMDGRWFFHVGAGYSGMVMMDTDPANFNTVGLRMPTVKSWMPLPGGSRTREKLDYCLTSTPAMVGGLMFFRGSDSLYCYDLRRPGEAELARMRQEREKQAEQTIRSFRAGKMDAATAIAEILSSGCEETAGKVVAEEMQKALAASDAKRFGALAAASASLGVAMSPSLGPLINGALTAGRTDLALAAMCVTGLLAGPEAEKAKPVLAAFLRGPDPKMWEPAAALLRTLDAASDANIVRNMSRFDQADGAAAVMAAVDVIGSIAGTTRDEEARKTAVGALVKYLDCNDTSCQKTVIARLRALGPQALAARSKLEQLVESSDVAEDAGRALEQIVPVPKGGPKMAIDVPSMDP